jgi:hypothetical protein
LKTLSRKNAKCKLDLARVQKFQWKESSTEGAAAYTFYKENDGAECQLRTGFCVYKGIVLKQVGRISRREEAVSKNCSCNTIAF